MDLSKEKLTLLLLTSPEWRYRLYAYDDRWRMYRYPQPEGKAVARFLARSIRTAPFTAFPEQRVKATQSICEHLRGQEVERDEESEERYAQLNLTLRLAGVHHPYVLTSPGAVHHLGVPFVELDHGFRAYPVGELAPPKTPRASQ